ncbi:hypothetical protein ABZ801_11305 [Actinomadura sp. NPDC047616]|uniref:hypothetical protein n=1 Tax=Actinomadura sp. NPDC047616 TaxID=3155914 RepID=UPI0033E218B3
MEPEDQMDLLAEIHAALAQVNASVQAAHVPVDMLDVLVATGEAERAEVLAERAGARACRTVIVALWRHGERERARRLLARTAFPAVGPHSPLHELVRDLLGAGAADEARAAVDACLGDDAWARAEIAAEFVRHGHPDEGLDILAGHRDFSGQVVRALIEAGRLGEAEETARRGGAPLGEIALAFADHGDPARADEFALLADAEPAGGPTRERDDMGACAALTRVGRFDAAVARLAKLARTPGNLNLRPLAKAHDWAGILWGEHSGWAPHSPRRYAAAAMADEAIRAGTEGRLLAAAPGCDLLRAAVAIAFAQSGDDRAARRHLALVTSVEGRVEGRLALAEALTGTDPAVAAEAAVQALEIVDDAAQGRSGSRTEPYEWRTIRTGVCEETAVLLARAGRPDDALRVADGLPANVLGGAAAFRRLAEALGRRVGEPGSPLGPVPGEPADAAEAVDAVTATGPAHGDVVVQAVLRTRTDEEIDDLLPSFTGCWDRAADQTRAARGLLDAGRTEAARRVALHLVASEPPGPSGIRRRLTRPAAVRLALDGDLDGAVALARADPHVLVAMVVSLLDAGSVDAARRVIAGHPSIASDLAGRLEHHGLFEYLPLVGFPAADPNPDVGNGERHTAELLRAPDGAAEFTDEILNVDPDVLIRRLLRAGKFRTALNVATIPDHELTYDGLVPTSLRVSWRIRVATAAHERAPSLAAWALDVAETTYRNARHDDAAVLAEIAAFPGWPRDRALALFRDALALTRHGTHELFLSVLDRSVPLLARHGVLHDLLTE